MNWKNSFINLTVIVVTVAVVFLILEGVSRIVLPAPQTIEVTRVSPPQEIVPGQISDRMDDRFFEVLPTGTTRLKKNLKVNIKNVRESHLDVEIMTNSLGYRYKELGEKGPNDFRILVLGDSITFAGYLPSEFTYPNQIERFLSDSMNPELKGKNVEVINAGVDGLDLSEEYLILKETGLSTHPDVVLVGLYLNDAVHSVSIDFLRFPRFLEHSYFFSFLREKIDILRKQYAFQRANYKLSRKSWEISAAKQKFKRSHEMAASPDEWRDSDAAFNFLIYDSFKDFGCAWSETCWDLIDRTVDLLQKESLAHGFKLAFVLFPTRYQVQSNLERNEPQAFFEEIMKKRKIAHLDLLQELRQKYFKDRLDVYYDQCHLTADGTRFVGKTIAQFIETNVIGVHDGN